MVEDECRRIDVFFFSVVDDIACECFTVFCRFVVVAVVVFTLVSMNLFCFPLLCGVSLFHLLFNKKNACWRLF